MILSTVIFLYFSNVLQNGNSTEFYILIEVLYRVAYTTDTDSISKRIFFSHIYFHRVLRSFFVTPKFPFVHFYVLADNNVSTEQRLIECYQSTDVYKSIMTFLKANEKKTKN